MADYCYDCNPFGHYNDLGDERGWYLCEGCGYHIFVFGVRICRAGPIPDEARTVLDMLIPCEVCASFVGTDEAP